MKPRRSVLYMPGSNARLLEKGRSLPADALILDLEDGVAPDAKELARTQVCAAVAAGGYGHREIIVRINGLDTPHGPGDLQAALAVRPDAILIPKLQGAEDLHHVRKAAAQGENGRGVALWAMMETPLGILNLKEIGEKAASQALPLTCFVMGTNDLVKATRIRPGKDRKELSPWFSMTVAAARAYGLAVIDGVFTALSDDAGLRTECEQAYALGMDGKTVIHPNQIATCNDVFSPSPEDIAEAKKIVEAFARPENEGKGAISLDGRMVELLHAEIARETLALANAIAARAS